MLNKTGKDGHPGLDPDVKGTYFSFSQLSVMLAVDLSHTVCIIFNCFLYAHTVGSFY